MKSLFFRLTSFSHVIFTIVSLILALSSCNSCSKKGCTDPQSENFEIDAKIDDGSCVYARDKFIGEYLVTANCPDDFASFNMKIISSELSAAQIIVVLSKDGEAYTIDGSVSGNNINIPRQILAQEVQIELQGVMQNSDLQIIGNYTAFYEDEQATCNFIATKSL